LSGGQAFLKWSAEDRYLRALRPALEQMPANQPTCSGNPNGFSCGWGGSHPTGKAQLVEEFNKIVADANSIVEGKVSLQEPLCVAGQDHRDDWVRTVVNQDTLDLAVLYSSHFCTGAVQSAFKALGLDSTTEAALRQALKEDPRMLNRYQIDVLGSSSDLQTRLPPPFLYANFESKTPELLNYLCTTGLVFYLPDIIVPLNDADGSAWSLKNRTLDESSPLSATVAPLLTSESGLELAQDLTALQAVASKLPPVPVLQAARVTDEFISQLRDAEKASLQKIYDQIDPDIAKIKSSIEKLEQKDFTVGITVGIGAGVTPGMYFTYNGYGVGVSLPSSGGLNFGPILPFFRIPELPLLTPDTSSPGGNPLMPSFDSPTKTISSRTMPPSAADIDPPDGVSVLSSIDWGSLLSQDNYVGRVWLQTEISIATPLLSPTQLQAIAQGLKDQTFPPDLAQLVAKKATEAVGNTNVTDPTQLLTQSLQDSCNSANWSSCGVAVMQGLNDTNDPGAVVALGLLWDKAFDAQFDSLRKSHHLESATPEAERIEGAVNDNFNPIEIIKDKAKETLVKEILPKLATLLKWVSSKLAVVLSTFLESQDVATDYDELKLMNDAIQDRVFNALDPYLTPDWTDELAKTVTRSFPQAGPLPQQ